MKKIISLLCFSLLYSIYSIAAENVAVTMVNNRNYNGKLISTTDSLLTIQWDKTFKPLDLPLSKILFAKVGPKYFVNKDSVLTEVNQDEYMQFLDEIINGYSIATSRLKEKSKDRSINTSKDPNLVIAKALKTSGASAIGVGIPVLAIGTILTGYGYGSKHYLGHGVYAHNDTEVNCQTAGLVMMGIGGGMTLVGIPLYCTGNKAMKVILYLQSNGAGLALNF